MKWLLGMLSEAPGEPSVRRCAFAFVVFCSMALCFFGLAYKISDNVRIIALALITATATSVTAGRFAEGMDKRGGQ